MRINPWLYLIFQIPLIFKTPTTRVSTFYLKRHAFKNKTIKNVFYNNRLLL